ncbi:dienelactone hydrolase family protein [Vulcanococcus sp.]|uniref:dienelactone hydrolase family protein n=1 Tax=Vulcanococcus sp. TaxID=2856995 RepID=UPI003C04BE9E
MPAWWVCPERPRAAVLVFPEVFGLNAWVRSVAERLAQEGYAALAISTFSRTAPDLDVGYDEAGLAAGREHRDLVRADQLLLDVDAAIAWLQNTPAAGKPVGSVGFCFGGHLALLAASHPQIAATCNFYGARVSSFKPGEPGAQSLSSVPQIPGRLWCFCGSEDPLMPMQEQEAIQQALAAMPHAGHRYVQANGAGHGYMCEARNDFHPEAAAAGWKSMLALFAETL